MDLQTIYWIAGAVGGLVGGGGFIGWATALYRVVSRMDKGIDALKSEMALMREATKGEIALLSERVSVLEKLADHADQNADELWKRLNELAIRVAEGPDRHMRPKTT